MSAPTALKVLVVECETECCLGRLRLPVDLRCDPSGRRGIAPEVNIRFGGGKPTLAIIIMEIFASHCRHEQRTNTCQV